MSDDGDPELLAFLGEDAIIHAIEDWAAAHPDDFLSAIGSGFDVARERRAVRARAVRAKPDAVRQIELRDGKLFASVDFEITYKNPIDDEDRDMSAENIVRHPFEIQLDEPVVSSFEFGDFDIAPDS
ncbi:MAG: hypothetical protein M3Y17_13905 [Actinomycetota bacterium]|nr:hypothetical protein [Actinomycetota bacterium]